MDANEAAEQIRRVIRVELDDVEIAIKADNKSKALDELDDAMQRRRSSQRAGCALRPELRFFPRWV